MEGGAALHLRTVIYLSVSWMRCMAHSRSCSSMMRAAGQTGSCVHGFPCTRCHFASIFHKRVVPVRSDQQRAKGLVPGQLSQPDFAIVLKTLKIVFLFARPVCPAVLLQGHPALSTPPRRPADFLRMSSRGTPDQTNPSLLHLRRLQRSG